MPCGRGGKSKVIEISISYSFLSKSPFVIDAIFLALLPGNLMSFVIFYQIAISIAEGIAQGLFK